MTKIRLYQIDAFTNTPFKGNPAAVCVLDTALSDAHMLAIAAEMNLSETAFVQRPNAVVWKNSQRFSLRWFTPATEVRLCGHATLATAACLFDCIGVKAKSLTFETLSSDLIASQSKEGIVLDFPSNPPQTCEPPADLLAALSLDATQVVNAAFSTNTSKRLLHLADAQHLRDLQPDFAALLNAESMKDFMGLIVTTKGTDYDFISRFFAPWVGINEDPVTGSAHTVLTPYWAERLGKTELCAYQASPRGGELTVRLRDDGRVELEGQAVVVMEGALLV